jgi:hypothetical protein
MDVLGGLTQHEETAGCMVVTIATTCSQCGAHSRCHRKIANAAMPCNAQHTRASWCAAMLSGSLCNGMPTLLLAVLLYTAGKCSVSSAVCDVQSDLVSARTPCRLLLHLCLLQSVQHSMDAADRR